MPKKILDFSEINKSEETISTTWSSFRGNLADKKFCYNNIEAAKETTFLKVFDDIFSHCHMWLEKSLNDLLTAEKEIVRAARMIPDMPTPDYQRFIPDSNYIKSHNRFSPPGVEWLYLAVASSSARAGELSIAEKTALKECRATLGESFALCHFNLRPAHKTDKVIDLTIAKDYSYAQLNNDLEKRAEQIHQREVSKGIIIGKTMGIIPNSDARDLKPAFEKWSIFTYARLLAEQIFLPIYTEDREIMYAPFQCMANYFLQKGYKGIVYSSTVFPEGKNLVLFNKGAADPVGKIENLEITHDI